MPSITADDLATRLFDRDDSPLVLDIRHEEEFAEWHIPGSVNVDVYDALQDDPEAAKAALDDLPADEEIVTVCAAGVISQDATAALRELGYDAATLEDGMNGWSRVHLSAPLGLDIPGTLVQVARPGKGCLSYILAADGEAAVVDPSHYYEEYERRIEALDAELVGVYDTHAHADHVSGGEGLAERHDVPYHLHPADADGIDPRPVTDGQRFTVGDVTVEVIHTPGHSPGGVSYAIDDAALLTGDTLFHESVGRVELGVDAGIEDADVAENAATLYESLERLRDRDGDPYVLPAHDPGSPRPPVTARLQEVEARNGDLGLDLAAFVGKLVEDVPEHPPNFQEVKRANIGRAEVPEEDLASLELGPNRCAAE